MARLKAGTATTIVLNLLTTSAMIRVGKAYGNLMVVMHERRLSYVDAEARLRAAGGSVRRALEEV
jgi:N-acetylmuramic acid 6-phosphate etherase